MKTQTHSMPAERYRAPQAHQRFCAALAGCRMNPNQRRPIFGFVQRVMSRHARFVSRLSARRRWECYFSGLNFVFALPLMRFIHGHDKLSRRTAERLVASHPLLFHTTEIKNVLPQTGGTSLSRLVTTLPMARPGLRPESRPSTARVSGENVYLSPAVSRGASLGQNILYAGTSLFQPRQGMLDLSQQRLITNLFYGIRNVFSGTKPGIRKREVSNGPRQDWPGQGSAFVQRFDNWPRHASGANVRGARPAPEKSHDDLTFQTGMPKADAEAAHASHHQVFSDLQNLIAAQPWVPDSSPEERFMAHSGRKNYPATATAPELIHKAHPIAEGKSPAQPPAENGSSTAVAQRRLKPVGIAEPPPPEAFKSIDHLADHVITIIEKRLQTERERRGIFA